MLELNLRLQDVTEPESEDLVQTTKAAPYLSPILWPPFLQL